MKISNLIFLIFPILFIISCDKTEEIVNLLDEALTEEEVTEGLKEALTIGTDTAVSIVSVIDGYYGDEIIKIFLPPEADIIVDNMDDPLLIAIGIDVLIEDVILRINRAAEDAATEAIPIFVDAITSMTITDAFEILNGEDTAATHYLKQNTYNELKEAFQPKINIALDKPLVGGISTNESWNILTTAYNNIAQFIPEWNEVNTDLDEHATKKALDGLFIKVADEEKDIRNDPLARVTDILRKVFGGN